MSWEAGSAIFVLLVAYTACNLLVCNLFVGKVVQPPADQPPADPSDLDAMQRAAFLDVHGAPKNWVIVTTEELTTLKETCKRVRYNGYGLWRVWSGSSSKWSDVHWDKMSPGLKEQWERLARSLNHVNGFSDEPNPPSPRLIKESQSHPREI